VTNNDDFDMRWFFEEACGICGDGQIRFRSLTNTHTFSDVVVTLRLDLFCGFI
jgi:hypothetical protein